MNIMDILGGQLGDQVGEQLQTRFGIPAEKAKEILPKMAPFVLKGVQDKVLSSNGDLSAAHKVLEDHGDEDAVDDVAGHFDRVEQSGGGLTDALGGLLGGGGGQQAMASQLGVSSDMLGKMLPVLAPLILGAVTKNTAGVGKNPQSGGGLGAILGSVLGGGAGSGILGQVAGQVLSGGGANKAGCLSAILGGLLGGKK
jgi:hypothetical protein